MIFSLLARFCYICDDCALKRVIRSLGTLKKIGVEMKEKSCKGVRKLAEYGGTWAWRGTQKV